MMGKIKSFAAHLAHKHPILDIALVAVGSVAVVEGLITLFKPKTSTAQAPATTTSTTTGG